MIRNDTLMRFIRIFSELANSIRYSVNKRVMLEMALIKLCKPEAEKDELSLIERIRKLEREIEKQEALLAELDAKVEAAAADYQELTRLLGEKEAEEARLLEMMEQWEQLQYS